MKRLRFHHLQKQKEEEGEEGRYVGKPVPVKCSMPTHTLSAHLGLPHSMSGGMCKPHKTAVSRSEREGQESQLRVGKVVNKSTDLRPENLSACVTCRKERERERKREREEKRDR